jgi:hypothetical protein
MAEKKIPEWYARKIKQVLSVRMDNVASNCIFFKLFFVLLIGDVFLHLNNFCEVPNQVSRPLIFSYTL